MKHHELCPLISALSHRTSHFTQYRPTCNHCCMLMFFDFLFHHCDDPLGFIGTIRKEYENTR